MKLINKMQLPKENLRININVNIIKLNKYNF